MTRWLILWLVFVAVAGCSDPQPPTTTGQQVDLAWGDPIGGCTWKERREVVITDAEALDAFWAAACNGSPPTIDFAATSVVGYFAGQSQFGGPTVTLDTATREGDKAVIGVSVWRTGNGCPATQAITHPGALRRVELLPEEVVFDVQGRLRPPCTTEGAMASGPPALSS